MSYRLAAVSERVDELAELQPVISRRSETVSNKNEKGRLRGRLLQSCTLSNYRRSFLLTMPTIPTIPLPSKIRLVGSGVVGLTSTVWNPDQFASFAAVKPLPNPGPRPEIVPPAFV